jgi:hypothetical protein
LPTRPVHLVVAYAAGGTGDIVARLISDRLAAALGQSVVVENRAGASGSIGTQSVVSAAADGHTLLLGQPAEVAINQHWIKGLAYDPDKDLQAVALVTVVPLALVVPAAAPYSTLPDMLKAATGRGLSFEPEHRDILPASCWGYAPAPSSPTSPTRGRGRRSTTSWAAMSTSSFPDSRRLGRR